ncbi:helix-turn-helix transcriptional regulator [Pedobacter yulinensis]|uniref:Helix-turn-helix transcriptional regulator n=1 Tax=Pedobacter yulinensis TaxID=2126353 RepID=A0A2T3HNH0_9SPHI|nr:LuxR C-terminal-related transcriptional regulator [Pedobacter yulinensis]PST83943.1 helix-turn-helix transcriptional regulator [Pedobacter yulinensis]
MNDIAVILGNQLLSQDFEQAGGGTKLEQAKHLASLYASADQAIVVLSDLVFNKSYVYYGSAAAALGLQGQLSGAQIDSIWEEEVFARIHPDDLQAKHMQELRFFHFLKGISPAERSDYHVVRKLRMYNAMNRYVPVLHRMYYLLDLRNDHTEMALCLYGFDHFPSDHFEGRIVNARTGEAVPAGDGRANMLSRREQEVLSLIDSGKASKEIAGTLCISLNTVNRHRQNILEKLRVSNSIEACRVARSFNWIG